MGVGVNARGDPQQNPRDFADSAGQPVQERQLLKAVRHIPADPRLQGLQQFCRRFVVAVEVDPLRGNPRLQGRMQLSSGDHIDAQPLLPDDLAHGQGAEGLAGVEDPGVRVPVREAVFQQPAAAPDAVLIHDVERRAHRPGQGHHIAAAVDQVPLSTGLEGRLLRKRIHVPVVHFEISLGNKSGPGTPRSLQTDA